MHIKINNEKKFLDYFKKCPSVWLPPENGVAIYVIFFIRLQHINIKTN